METLNLKQGTETVHLTVRGFGAGEYLRYNLVYLLYFWRIAAFRAIS